MPIARKVLAATAGLLALAACATTPEPAPTTSAATTTTPATTVSQVGGITCAKAPEEVVGAALRLNLKHPRETLDGPLVTCRYDGGGAATLVRFHTASDASVFARGKEGFGKTADVPGFFDEAYTGTLGTGEVVQNTLVARRGPVEIMVTSGANFEQEKELVTRLFAGL
ncbi:hypothetical protein [Saccharothrix obliqua]|uniref:hypothetical protein n=1 Tax=Saccharothrix obliqua TaxID=2861747 RepID=UPI001C5F4AED|nr:hypothetical protein [Saccharothrix obliqua]MBW4720832.1 hypothetical protein [Saccharothrix obliqua]